MGKHRKRMAALSRAMRASIPFCECCRTRPGVEVHHVIKWADSETSRLDPSNLVVVCRDCHELVERGLIPVPARG